MENRIKIIPQEIENICFETLLVILPISTMNQYCSEHSSHGNQHGELKHDQNRINVTN